MTDTTINIHINAEDESVTTTEDVKRIKTIEPAATQPQTAVKLLGMTDDVKEVSTCITTSTSHADGDEWITDGDLEPEAAIKSWMNHQRKLSQSADIQHQPSHDTEHKEKSDSQGD